MTAPPNERSTTMPADAAVEAALAGARRELITHRLPIFAAGWIAIGMILRAGLIAHGGLSPRIAVVSIALQMAVLAVALAWCRAVPSGTRVPRIVLGTCVALILSAAGFFTSLGGSVEGFVFAVLMICVGSSLAFAWGWAPALTLLAVGGGVGGVAISGLQRFSDPIEIFIETLIGAVISLMAAEVSARSFARSFRQAHLEREASRRLAEAHDAYRDLAENARDLIYTHDIDGRITYVNEAFARSCGVAAADLIGRDATDLVPRDPVNPDPAALRARMAAGEEFPPQLYWVNGPEGRRWLECVASAIRDGDGRIVGARGIVRDVTERHNAEEALRASLEELRRSEERLRQLAHHQESIREDERKRLGFDLHDDVCQELIGIGILVEAARRRSAEMAPALEPDLDRIGRYVGEVGEHLRQLARDLRPMLLRDLGLEESLHSMAEGMTAPGTQVTAVFPTAIPRLGEDTEIGVYRIAQEALANAVRHAGARTIRITLAVRGRDLEIAIADDGCGFSLANRRGSDSLGLVGMEERALALGGRLELRSAPGQGTTVRLTCPVALRAASAA
jgi:two-component system sensor histidine kinase UhpB